MTGLGSRRNFPCADCREQPPEAIGRIYGATLYDDIIADAIQALKFHGKYRLAGPLGELLVAFAGEHMELTAYDALVPVPLHRVRHRERGFNQSVLLAQACIDTFPQATLCTDLERIRPTRTQSTLAGAHRAQNVRGAFAVSGDGLKGKRVLLIDDVVTSGGTVVECAKALQRAGAPSVDVLAVALVAHRASR
jgi:ComF family protein